MFFYIKSYIFAFLKSGNQKFYFRDGKKGKRYKSTSNS